jgi:hypothetical protein
MQVTNPDPAIRSQASTVTKFERGTSPGFNGGTFCDVVTGSSAMLVPNWLTGYVRE